MLIVKLFKILLYQPSLRQNINFLLSVISAKYTRVSWHPGLHVSSWSSIKDEFKLLILITMYIIRTFCATHFRVYDRLLGSNKLTRLSCTATLKFSPRNQTNMLPYVILVYMMKYCLYVCMCFLKICLRRDENDTKISNAWWYQYHIHDSNIIQTNLSI